MSHQIHRNPKELALQILDIVSIRPEVGINYIGIQSKCFEILEKRNGEKDEEFDGSDSGHNVPASGEELSGSDNDDDSDDDLQIGNVETQSMLSDEPVSDGEDSGSDIARPQMIFRLREILFYDDKITIFKARHGVL